MNLKQLSHTLGLSQTTVSRALNGYPEVAEATRLRVQQAAARYHYRPNARAQGLATGQARAIGHVIPVSDQHEMVNPIFADFTAGAGEIYQKHGYEMLLSRVSDGAGMQVCRDMAAKGTVDGLIVHSPRPDDGRIAFLNSLRLPFVVHGRASEEVSGYSWVDVNNRRAFQRATDFLLDLGHRRIGFVNGLESMDFAHRRRIGHESALMARGITADPALMRSGEMTEEYGFRAACEMLHGPNRATALLVSSMIPAIGARRAAEAAGRRLGQDLSIIIHDDVLSYLRNGGTTPLFTAMRSSVRHAGRLCAKMLLELIRDPAAGPHQRLLEAELVVGHSTGPAS